jgi:hypothetical protein
MAIPGRRPRTDNNEKSPLENLQRSGPFVAVEELVNLLRRDVPLDPEWKLVWEKISADVRGALSQHMLSEIENAIAGIVRLDPAIESLRLTEQDPVCLLLGAGASAPAPSSIPTVAKLLPEMWQRARKLGREDIDRLAKWCEGRGVTNIEDLLTAAYLANFAAKKAGVAGLLDYFLFSQQTQDEEIPSLQRRVRINPASQVDAASVALFQETLQGLFGLLTSTMIPAKPNPAHNAIVEFAERHPKSSIVTTNYDGCVDEAFLTKKIPFATHVSESEEEQNNKLDLIKIHGSINWTYCDSRVSAH